MNGWAYAASNPINVVDPTGRFPTRCQFMPSARHFEECVLRQYVGLEPIDDATLGSGIRGSRGCYAGEFRFRAPGYIEGTETSVSALWWGHERVYSFARMESLSFDFEGVGLGTSGLGGEIVDYSGFAVGLKSTQSLSEHYKGRATTGNFGFALSTPVLGVPIGGASGLGGFISWEDHKLWGVTWYVAGSVAYSPRLVDAGLGLMLTFTPVVGTQSSYISADGRVDRAALLASIGLGWQSPWRINIKEAFPLRGVSRASAIVAALYYANAHEELHELTN